MVNPRQSSSSKEIRLRARELRRATTPAEQQLWEHLRNRKLGGLKFRRQHPIGRFIVDFYCAEHRLVIELDGPIHSRQSARDHARTAWLESRGYQELRFKNEQVNEQLQVVLEQIVAACHNDIWNEGDNMKIKIETIVKADIDSVWMAWNTPEDIKQWNAASDDWHTTQSTVDLRVGGTFTSRMEAKDGSMGFDFEGTYTNVVDQERIEYEMADGRSVAIAFEALGDGVKVTETFDAESEHEAEQQRQGWQSILDNFAIFVEAKANAGK